MNILAGFWFHTQRVGGKLNACRIATDANLSAIASHNESVDNKWLRPRGISGRKAVVRRGRLATGDVDRAGFNQGHVDEYHAAVAPGLPMPTLVETDDFPNLISHLDDGKTVIAIAVDLRADAELRRFVSGIGHEIGLLKRKRINKRWEVKVVDPAHGPSNTYRGHWISQEAVRKGAQAILDGIVVAELYPVGGWTQARLDTQRLRGKNRELDAELDEKEKLVRRLRNARTADRAAIKALEEQLRECEAGQAPDLDAFIARLTDKFPEFLEEQKQ